MQVTKNCSHSSHCRLSSSASQSLATQAGHSEEMCTQALCGMKNRSHLSASSMRVVHRYGQWHGSVEIRSESNAMFDKVQVGKMVI